LSEYAKVPKAEQKQTKQLCLWNIAFIRDGETLNHSSASLYLADCISITFEQQKNDRKEIPIAQWRTWDKLLCLVMIWASITRRTLSYKGTNKNSPVSLVKHKNTIINVTAEMIADLCRNGVVAIGQTKLGIRRSEIGTSFICSGAAMAMYVSGVPILMIMIIGRWSSTAFLKYIRNQVQEFSHGISSKMIEVHSHSNTSKTKQKQTRWRT
jgi:hypothetical protein